MEIAIITKQQKRQYSSQGESQERQTHEYLFLRSIKLVSLCEIYKFILAFEDSNELFDGVI